MSRQQRILIVLGTRPEAIKLAPVIEGLKRRTTEFEPLVVATAQHREMLDQVLDLFGILPAYDLDIMTVAQSPSEVIARTVDRLASLIHEAHPDAVLVQGDTTTTFAAALAAFHSKVPVGHVEAGLRTHDLSRPFPEEGNRQLVTRIARWHFAPTAVAESNLIAEGVDRAAIHVTGNTVIDALLETRDKPYEFGPGPVAEALASSCRLVLVTAHRRENQGPPLERICRAVAELVACHPDIHVLFATHRNPVVADVVERILGRTDRVDLIGPQEYLPFVKLMSASALILSDSGGIQEEAPTLGVPMLVLREITERPEAIDAGAVRLVGTETEHIVAEATRLLTDTVAYNEMARASNPFGDGHAAERIVHVLAGGAQAYA